MNEKEREKEREREKSSDLDRGVERESKIILSLLTRCSAPEHQWDW